MIEIHLTDQEIQDLNEAIDDPSHSEKTKIKLLVIRMRHEGAKTGFISKCLNLHSNTITNYLNEFQAGKLPATLENKYYKPTSSLEPFLPCIRCSFLAYPVADAKQAVERIHKLTGIRLSESQSRRFMKSLGLKLRKTAPVPGKCDHQLQFDFYTREMLPRLEEARLGKRKVLFVDAAHFEVAPLNGARAMLMKWAGREGVSTPKIDHEHETKKKTSDRRIQSPCGT